MKQKVKEACVATVKHSGKISLVALIPIFGFLIKYTDAKVETAQAATKELKADIKSDLKDIKLDIRDIRNYIINSKKE